MRCVELLQGVTEATKNNIIAFLQGDIEAFKDFSADDAAGKPKPKPKQKKEPASKDASSKEQQQPGKSKQPEAKETKQEAPASTGTLFPSHFEHR